MKLDIHTILEAQWDDGYGKIKAFLQPSEEIDYQELVDKETFIWKTAKGNLTLICEIGNAIQIYVRGNTEVYGYCCTPDHDTHALVCCVMSALRDYIKDIKYFNPETKDLSVKPLSFFKQHSDFCELIRYNAKGEYISTLGCFDENMHKLYNSQFEDKTVYKEVYRYDLYIEPSDDKD